MSLYCKTKSGQIFNVWSDNCSEGTFDCYPLNEVFCAESTNLTTIRHEDIENLDTNLSILQNKVQPKPQKQTLEYLCWGETENYLDSIKKGTGSTIFDLMANEINNDSHHKFYIPDEMFYDDGIASLEYFLENSFGDFTKKDYEALCILIEHFGNEPLTFWVSW